MEPAEIQRLLDELTSLIAYSHEKGFDLAKVLLKEEFEKARAKHYTVMGYADDKWRTISKEELEDYGSKLKLK